MAESAPRIVLHKASGLARCRVQGKDHYLGRYGSPEAAAAYARLLDDLAAGQLPRAGKAGPLTVAQLVASWQARVLPSYHPKGGEPYAIRRAVQPLLELFATLPARDLDAPRLEQVRQQMIKLGWCASHINRQVLRLRGLWRWAELQGHVPHGSWAHLRALPSLGRNNHAVRHTRAVQPCTWETVKAVLPYCPPMPKVMLLLQWWSGLRCGEICRMRAAEIDRSGPVWYYRPIEHKNTWRGQIRVAALGKKCQALLYKLLPLAEEYVFVSRQRRPYLTVSYARAILIASRRAGVSLHPYQCRHAFKQRVTRLLGLDAARAALGQASLGSTNGYAAQQDLDLARRVAERLC